MLRAECSEVVHELTSLYLLSQELQKVGVTRGELRDHLVDKVLLLLGFHRHHPPPSPDSVYRACYTVNAPVWLVLHASVMPFYARTSATMPWKGGILETTGETGIVAPPARPALARLGQLCDEMRAEAA